MNLATLISAAELKGYLTATDAPKEIIAQAQRVVDGLVGYLKPEVIGGIEEYRPKMAIPPTVLPEKEHLAAAIAAIAEKSPCHDESRFAAPETPHTEEIPSSAAEKVARNDGVPEEDAEGAGEEPEFLSTGDKHKRYRGKLKKEGRCPRCGVECAPYAECEAHRKYRMEKRGVDEYKRPEGHGQRAPRRVSQLDGRLVEIQALLKTESFGVVGHRYGVSGETVKNFLKRHGIDTAQYRKSGGNPNLMRKGGDGGGDNHEDTATRSRSEYCWEPEKKQLLIDMKASGSSWPDIAAVIGKTVAQCRSMYHLIRHKTAESGSQRHVQAGAPGGRGARKLFAEDLPVILEELKTRSFADCGALHGVTGHAIIDFLKRSGVDHGQFKKNPGYGVKASRAAVADDDAWPEATKPERTMVLKAVTCPRERAVMELMASLPDVEDRSNSRLKRHDIARILKYLGTTPMLAVAERMGESPNTIDNFLKRYGIDYRTLPAATATTTPLPVKPLMQFETVKVKDSWGNESERDIPLPVGKYNDPETGAKVTKYPPGYAMGTYPQRNVGAKGGS